MAGNGVARRWGKKGFGGEGTATAREFKKMGKKQIITSYGVREPEHSKADLRTHRHAPGSQPLICGAKCCAIRGKNTTNLVEGTGKRWGNTVLTPSLLGLKILFGT